MLRKKEPPKQRVLAINAHDGAPSPHRLDLRALKSEEPRGDGAEHAGSLEDAPSFEERIAAFDDRVKEMPELVRSHAKAISRAWQSQATSFLDATLNWGARAQTQLKDSRQYIRKRISRRRASRRAVSVVVSYMPAVAHFVFLILLITIPLQILFVYREISSTKVRVEQAWKGALLSVSRIQEEFATQQFDRLPEEFAVLTRNVATIRKVFDRMRPLAFFLPDRIVMADIMTRISEDTIAMLSRISFGALEVQGGTKSRGALVRSAFEDLTALHTRARVLVPDDREPITSVVREGIGRVYDIATVAAHLFAAEEPRRVLFIFQNPRELRASGGFAGSFALVTVRDGDIENIEIPEAGTYAIEGQVSLSRISPAPLHLINPRFEFQDSNWWPEFPRSAKKMKELFEAAGGPTVDAVVAVTAHVGEELLRIHGPIVTNEATLNADNFIDTLQSTVARDRSIDRRAPKKIITALVPTMVQATTNLINTQPHALLTSAARLFSRKDIQVWSRDEEVQAAVRRLGWSGEFSQEPGDFLSVITSNVGGGKTDGVVESRVTHAAQLTAAGVAQESLRISRVHNGQKGDTFLGYRNVAYLRVYVPEGAKLRNATGSNPPSPLLFERPASSLTPDPEVRATESTILHDQENGVDVWQEDNKTVFGVWMSTDPGQTSEVELTYEVSLLSYRNTVPYTFTVEPQAGTRVAFASTVSYDSSLRGLVGGDSEWNPQGWHFEGPLEKRLITSAVLYRQ